MESVDLYEIKDSELELFERGSSGDLQLNFAIFLLSTSFSAICTLATATFINPKIENTFLFVAVSGVLGGIYLLIAWWLTRQSLRAVCARIRERIPPNVAIANSEVHGDSEDPEPQLPESTDEPKSPT